MLDFRIYLKTAFCRLCYFMEYAERWNEFLDIFGAAELKYS